MLEALLNNWLFQEILKYVIGLILGGGAAFYYCRISNTNYINNVDTVLSLMNIIFTNIHVDQSTFVNNGTINIADKSEAFSQPPAVQQIPPKTDIVWMGNKLFEITKDLSVKNDFILHMNEADKLARNEVFESAQVEIYLSIKPLVNSNRNNDNVLLISRCANSIRTDSINNYYTDKKLFLSEINNYIKDNG